MTNTTIITPHMSNIKFPQILPVEPLVIHSNVLNKGKYPTFMRTLNIGSELLLILEAQEDTVVANYGDSVIN